MFSALADDRRSDDLDRRIASARATEAARSAAAPGPAAKGYGQGSRVLMELIGAPLGGGVIGWALDRWFTGTHWALVIGVVLGFVVAFRNIYRIAKEQAA